MSLIGVIGSAARRRVAVGVVGDPFVSSFTPDNTRSDFTGWVGYSFVVGGADVTLNGLGRWKLTGNTGTREVKITNLSGAEIVAATVDLDDFAAGEWASASVTPVTLAAGVTYSIQSLETAGGATWHNVSTFAVDAVAGTIRARYASNGSQTWANVDYIANYMYVPQTFFFEP